MAAGTKQVQDRRKKHEIVLGIVCPLGTNYEPMLETLENYVQRFRYRAERIHLSHGFDELLVKLGEDPEKLKAGKSNLEAKIIAGDRIRQRARDSRVLAEFATWKIASARDQGPGPAPSPMSGVCHVIVQLKRPEEVDVLRMTYGHGFYLVGLFSDDRERRDFLRRRDINDETAQRLIATDSEEKTEYGQRTAKTFQLADVFISSREYERQIPRFLDLVFGHPFTTPTRDERAMFMAFASALSSADLSRQVGASIVNDGGDLIALGYNEVPKFGGGAYQDGSNSHRDVERGEDSNHAERVAIANRIFKVLDGKVTREEANQAFQAAGLFDITEYGRAVHAEMDALLACARTLRSPAGCTLYTTTFPCHNCTRHIIAAGIRRVVYVEPYPKSKASQLHGDAIDLSGSEGVGGARLPFMPFIGVGPRRYLDLFSMRLGSGVPLARESGGKPVEWSRESADPRLQMLPSSYLQREHLSAKQFEEVVRCRAREDDDVDNAQNE